MKYTVKASVDSDLHGQAGRLVMQFDNGSCVEVTLDQVVPMTVYCANWKAHGESCFAVSNTSWAALETKVFGQPYAPSRAEVSFTSYQHSQGVS